MEIWTDGSCEPNPGPGGWGWVRSDGAEVFGGSIRTTNNRMELIGILESLQALPNDAVVTVWSDSLYCVYGLTTWRSNWKKKNWMKGNPMKAMLNRDLWMALEEQIRRVDVTFKWVRGHSGNLGNEAADALANQGRLQVITGNIEPQFDPVEEFKQQEFWQQLRLAG